MFGGPRWDSSFSSFHPSPPCVLSCRCCEAVTERERWTVRLMGSPSNTHRLPLNVILLPHKSLVAPRRDTQRELYLACSQRFIYTFAGSLVFLQHMSTSLNNSRGTWVHAHLHMSTSAAVFVGHPPQCNYNGEMISPFFCPPVGALG